MSSLFSHGHGPVLLYNSLSCIYQILLNFLDARDHFVYFNLSSHLRREAHFGMKWALGEVLAVSGHFMEVEYS